MSVFSSCSCRAGGRVIHHESILGEEEGIVALRDDEEAKTHPPSVSEADARWRTIEVIAARASPAVTEDFPDFRAAVSRTEVLIRSS